MHHLLHNINPFSITENYTAKLLCQPSRRQPNPATQLTQSKNL
jgi:hypothetical protein